MFRIPNIPKNSRAPEWNERISENLVLSELGRGLCVVPVHGTVPSAGGGAVPYTWVHGPRPKTATVVITLPRGA